MKTRRHIVHTSFKFNADFLAYYCGDRLVSLVVEGDSLPINGKVDAATFKHLLRDIREKEARCPRVPHSKRTFDPGRPEGDGRPSSAVLPRANMREVLTLVYGRYENRNWWR